MEQTYQFKFHLANKYGMCCSYQSCHWADYVEEKDWGYYSETNGDCTGCQVRCLEDFNCGAVECGKGYCCWWKKGVFTQTQANSFEDTLTCRNLTYSEILCSSHCIHLGCKGTDELCEDTKGVYEPWMAQSFGINCEEHGLICKNDFG